MLAWGEEASSALQRFPVVSFSSKCFKIHSWLFIIINILFSTLMLSLYLFQSKAWKL